MLQRSIVMTNLSKTWKEDGFHVLKGDKLTSAHIIGGSRKIPDTTQIFKSIDHGIICQRSYLREKPSAKI